MFESRVEMQTDTVERRELENSQATLYASREPQAGSAHVDQHTPAAVKSKETLREARRRVWKEIRPRMTYIASGGEGSKSRLPP